MSMEQDKPQIKIVDIKSGEEIHIETDEQAEKVLASMAAQPGEVDHTEDD